MTKQDEIFTPNLSNNVKIKKGRIDSERSDIGYDNTPKAPKQQ